MVSPALRFVLHKKNLTMPKPKIKYNTNNMGYLGKRKKERREISKRGVRRKDSGKQREMEAREKKIKNRHRRIFNRDVFIKKITMPTEGNQ